MAQGAGIVIEDIDAQKLTTILQEITPDKLRTMNKTIMKKQKIMLIEDMSKLIETCCYGCKS